MPRILITWPGLLHPIHIDGLSAIDEMSNMLLRISYALGTLYKLTEAVQSPACSPHGVDCADGSPSVYGPSYAY